MPVSLCLPDIPDTEKTVNQVRPNHSDFRHSNNFLDRNYIFSKIFCSSCIGSLKITSEKQKSFKISSKIPEAVKCVSGRPMVIVSSVRYLLPRFTNYLIFRNHGPRPLGPAK